MKKTLPLALLLGLAVVGCNGAKESAQQTVAGEPIAWVNGEAITKEAFQFHLERRTQGFPERASPEDRKQLLEELVELTLLAQEARQQKLDQDPVVAARIDNLRNAVLAQAQVEKLNTEQAGNDAALQAEYDKRFGGGKLNEYHARHILVKDEAKAKELIAALKGGADFGELAQKNSSDSTSGNGGDLGWFQAEQMVQPFSEAVKGLQPGQITEQPVQTQFGWHVIKLEETRPLTPPKLEEVRAELVQSLTQDRIQKHIDELRGKAEIRYEGDAKPAEQAPAQSVPKAQDAPTEQKAE